VIKHQRRYFFTQYERHEDSELFGPDQILNLIFSFAQDEGAFIVLPRGTHIFRARRQPDGMNYASAGTLGPPPVERAVQTNRMSPPGVVMTYAADDIATAVAETANAPGLFAIGEFVTERDALILDLTRLPPIPSAFAELPDSLEYDPRPRLRFLHRISREISRPIARDDRVHIEYVPTQVVTEYVRTAITIENRSVDGIRYKSSRRKAQTALVLFADQDNVILEKSEQRQFYHLARDRWLRLIKASVKRVTAEDIEAWSKPGGGLFGDL
jgi:RES domain